MLAPLDGGAIEGDAASPTADAGPADAWVPPDATSPIDAGPPTEGCFAGDVTLATHTFDPAGRPHLMPIGIVPRVDGWLVVYEFYGAVHAVDVDVEGGVRSVQPLEWPSGDVVGLAASTLVFTDPLQRYDTFGHDGRDRLSPAMGEDELGGGLSEHTVAQTLVAPGVLRTLSRGYAGLPRHRIYDIALDDSPDGLRVARSQPLDDGALPYEASYFVHGDAITVVIPGEGTWRATRYEYDGDTLGTDAFELRVVADVSWASTDFNPVAVTPDGRHVLVGRYGAEDLEAYLAPIPYEGSTATGRAVGPGVGQALLEDGGRLIVATNRSVQVLGADDLAPLGEVSFDGIEYGTVRAATRQGTAAAIFVSQTDEPYTVHLAMRCTALPR